jgi:large subunit ribosomal protein L10
LTRDEKQQQVNLWQERLQSARAAVLTDFRGLNVAQITELRNKLREKQVEYQVVKNTLLRKATANIGQEALHEYLSGPTGIAYSQQDALEPAKVLSAFAKENEALKLKAAILEGKVINARQVQDVASLPSREVLIAKLLGVMQSPLTGLVTVLQANLRKLLLTLEAIKQQKSN